mgnify:CR=1 FL=1
MLRLSGDGITEISEYGMRDWFRDNLATLNDNYTNELRYTTLHSLLQVDQERNIVSNHQLGEIPVERGSNKLKEIQNKKKNLKKKEKYQFLERNRQLHNLLQVLIPHPYDIMFTITMCMLLHKVMWLLPHLLLVQILEI